MLEEWSSNGLYQQGLDTETLYLYILQGSRDAKCIHDGVLKVNRNPMIRCHTYTTHIMIVWCLFLECHVMTYLSLITIQYNEEESLNTCLPCLEMFIIY